MIATHIWESTLFVLAAGLMTLLFGRNRAAVRYGIWMAASVKFLVPFSLLTVIGARFGWLAPAIDAAPAMFGLPGIGGPSNSLAPAVTWGRLQAGAVPLAEVLLAIWLLGAAFNAFRWHRQWRRSRQAMLAGENLELDFPIPVRASAWRVEPGVFGILRPVLLLPRGIEDVLTPQQVRAVMDHELCHLKRRDNLTAAIHMAVEALFWFHPLVWWIEARLVEERESACDEAVLATDCDAESYAQSILNVCKLYVESPLTCMPGVTGSNLKKRIEAIMTHHPKDKLNTARKLALCLAGTAAVAVPLLIGIGSARPVRAQQQAPAGRLTFEVASVKPNASRDMRDRQMRLQGGGRITITAMPLFNILLAAYRIPGMFNTPRLSGGPDWMRQEAFDIEAVAPAGAVTPEMAPEERDQRVRQMLIALLTERFKLQVRHESKEIPVYAFTVARTGLKLKKSSVAPETCKDTGSDSPKPASDPCHRLQGGIGRGLHGQALTLGDIGRYVENWTDRPMIDQTELGDALFEVDTEGWVPMLATPRGEGPEAEAFRDPARPTLFQIFDKMGLKLESKRAPVDVYVVEHAEKPAAN